ncbi:hypothetical protein [Saccharopolyspora flava]|uniref:hypothetical protein n=1 Tax=Saccharopolyspora flava TaxID=95161 RepID=UPI000B878C48|nr:hypothetical protein [Saccharopolyspora flava]
MTSGHFWLPVAADGARARHAFRGRRWEGERVSEAVCGQTLPLAQPSEMDWITFKTCDECWRLLLVEAGISPEAVNAYVSEGG